MQYKRPNQDIMDYSTKLARQILPVFLLLVFLSQSMHAHALDFSFVYPDGEGDSESAKPYLENFFAYIKEKTGLDFTGDYYNDGDEFKESLAQKKPHIAIIQNDFLESLQGQLQAERLLQTIPIYSSGPYERLYILSGDFYNLLINPLVQSQTREIKIHASKVYTPEFVQQKLFPENPMFKNVTWKVEQTSDILSVLKKISSGEIKTMVLLTGYEHYVVKALIKSNEKFANLKLVFASPDLPSTPLVLLDKTALSADQVQKLKTTLIDMSQSLKGQVILKNLRLKGFALSQPEVKPQP